jgi:hypothetical protein
MVSGTDQNARAFYHSQFEMSADGHYDVRVGSFWAAFIDLETAYGQGTIEVTPRGSSHADAAVSNQGNGCDQTAIGILDLLSTG